MRRDLASLLWVFLTVAVAATILGTTMGPAAVSPALVLQPDPWIGSAVAGVVSFFAAGAAWFWAVGGRAQLRETQFGLRWRPSGTRQRNRIILAQVSGYVLMLGVWVLLGPSRVVDLTPFLQGAPPPADLVATCADPFGVPSAAAWAVGPMCRWNTAQWAPFIGGIVLVAFVAAALWHLRSRRLDVLGIELDANGITIDLEGETRRHPWSRVIGATTEEDVLTLQLRDADPVVVPRGNLSRANVRGIAREINNRVEPLETIDEATAEQMQRVQRVSEDPG